MNTGSATEGQRGVPPGECSDPPISLTDTRERRKHELHHFFFAVSESVHTLIRPLLATVTVNYADKLN